MSDLKRYQRPAPDFSKLALAALIFLWLLLIGFQLGKVYHTPIWRDDAAFAQAAKNLTLGHGYAIASFDTLQPFAPGISSGPVVILSAAFFIKLFGNTYWAPGLACIVLINLLLLIAYFQLKYLIAEDTQRRQCACLFLLAALLFTNHATGFAGERMHVWHALMGEVPSALFVIIAALHIARNRYDPVTIFSGGLLAGLGALCKLQSLFGAGMLGAYLLAHSLATLRVKQQGYRRVTGNILLYGAGIALPLVSFEIVKMLILGGRHNYEANNAALIVISRSILSFSSPGMILQKIWRLGEYFGLMEIPGRNSLFLDVLILILLGFFITAQWYFMRLLGKRMSVSSTPAEWACEALLACCMAHLLWWALLCPRDIPRYLTQGLLYGCAALAIAVSGKAPMNTYAGRCSTLAIVIIFLALRHDALAYLSTAMKYNAIYAESQQVVRILNAEKKTNPKTVFFSCGYTFELEYLLPDSGNFIPCERLQEPVFAGKNTILVTFAVNYKHQMIYYTKDSFDIQWRYNTDSARQLCPHDDIFKGESYSIASCPKK